MSIRHLLYRRVSHPLKIPEERKLLSPNFIIQDVDEDKNFTKTTGFQYNQDFRLNRDEDSELPIICTETRDYNPDEMSFLRSASLSDYFLRIRRENDNHSEIRLQDGTTIRIIPGQNSNRIIVFDRNGTQVSDRTMDRNSIFRRSENGEILIEPIVNQNDIGEDDEELNGEEFEINPKWLTGEVAVPARFKDSLKNYHPMIESLTSIRYEKDEKDENEEIKKSLMIENNLTDGVPPKDYFTSLNPEEIKKPLIIEDNLPDGIAPRDDFTSFNPSNIKNKNIITPDDISTAVITSENILDRGMLVNVIEEDQEDHFEQPIFNGSIELPDGSTGTIKPQRIDVSIIRVDGKLFYIENGKAICYSSLPQARLTYQDYLREFPPYHLAAYGYTRAQKPGLLRLFGKFDLYTHLIGSIDRYYDESNSKSKTKTTEDIKTIEQRSRQQSEHKITRLFKNSLNLINPDNGVINNFVSGESTKKFNQSRKTFNQSRKTFNLSWEDLEYPEGLGFISTIRSAEQLNMLNQLLNQLPFGKTLRGTEKKKFSFKGKIPFISVQDHQAHIKLARRAKRWQGGFYDPAKRTLTVSMEVIYFALMKEYPELKDRIGIQSNFEINSSFDCLPMEDYSQYILQTFYQFTDKTTDILSPLIEFNPTGLSLLPKMWTFPVATSLQHDWKKYFDHQIVIENASKSEEKDNHPLDSEVIEEYADRYICLSLKDDTSLDVNQISTHFQVDLTMIFPSPRLLEALYDLGQKIEVERQHGIIRLNLMQVGECGKREIFKSLFYKQN
jgi:hypothetical protein